MIITNEYKLPQAFVNAVTSDRKMKSDRLSVTDLIGSPLVRQLKFKHQEELTGDVSDMLWMILGQAVHGILDKNAPIGSVGEEKIEVPLGGFTVVGVPDLYHNGVISDYKVTSVWSFLLGEKVEWERQLNVYRWLLEKTGNPVARLEINAILRDFTKSKAGTNNYPDIPFQAITIPMWSMDEASAYVLKRVDLHARLAGECTPEEKWTRPTTYRVLKKGRKTAVRVFESLLQAEALIETNKDYYLEVRKGVDVKCENYCSVKTWCPYYKPTEKISPDQSSNEIQGE